MSGLIILCISVGLLILVCRSRHCQMNCWSDPCCVSVAVRWTCAGQPTCVEAEAVKRVSFLQEHCNILRVSAVMSSMHVR
jgi:hypothetical protein